MVRLPLVAVGCLMALNSGPHDWGSLRITLCG
jgi:hypothetical protein